MPVSDIVVAGLVVTPGFGQTFLEWTVDDPNWNGIEQLRLDRVEVWSRTSNDRGTDGALLASKVAEGITEAIHRATDGVARWYWIRARNRAGGYGDWYPSSQTGGIAAAATASIGTNGYLKLPNGVIEQWGQETTEGVNIGGGKQIVFPIEFPNACVAVEINPNEQAIANEAFICWPGNKNTTGVLVYGLKIANGSSTLVWNSSFHVTWRALGY